MSRWDILMMALGMFSAAIAQTTAAPVKIKILVYDYTRLASQPLSQSLEEAGRVFHKAGVELEWCVGTAASEECLAEKQRSGGPVLQLNLLDEKMAGPVLGESKRFGIALRDVAYINVARAQNLAQEGRFEAKVVLGHVMAHELGHLLLGPNAHTRGSIMTANLGVRELADAQCGALRFNPKEAERMRERLGRQISRAAR